MDKYTQAMIDAHEAEIQRGAEEGAKLLGLTPIPPKIIIVSTPINENSLLATIKQGNANES